MYKVELPPPDAERTLLRRELKQQVANMAEVPVEFPATGYYKLAVPDSQPCTLLFRDVYEVPGDPTQQSYTHWSLPYTFWARDDYPDSDHDVQPCVEEIPIPDVPPPTEPPVEGA